MLTEDDLVQLLKQNRNVIERLVNLGIIKITESDCLSYNIGSSDYSSHLIQPWTIWEEYKLNPWDADIVKRVLRTKVEPGVTPEAARIMDYEKIIHICKKRIDQIDKGIEI